MNKKYFETKTGSIEEKITQIATEQQSIKKQEPNVKLTAEKTYFETKPGSISDVAAKIVSEALDPVNKDAVKKKFDDRKDKDIDNDGDTDSTDKYLHKRRAAISKATSEAISPAQQAAIAISKKEKGEKPKNEEKVECSKCEGEGCSHCKDKGYHMEQICPKCGKDHANKINASNCMGESKKSFSDLRNETKEIQLGDKGKTLTGKKAGVIDVEPRSKPV